MTTLDKTMVSLDRGLLSGLLRILIGFFFVPALDLLRQDVSSAWTLILGLGLVLVCLRIVPVFLRKLLPLSSEVKAIWAERRQVAKQYDSFQWQKLFFVGTGLFCYLLISRTWTTPSISVSSFCILFGAIGVVVWYAQLSKVRKGLVNKQAI